MSEPPVPAAPERVPWYRVRVSPARQAAGIALLLALVAVIVGFYFSGMRLFLVDSISMEPTLWEWDRIVAYPTEEYARGDIVVLRDPTRDGGFLVKRLIGFPGDRIDVYGGGVMVNGTYASEPYRPEPIDYVLDGYVVPEGEVFVLGDNANWSVDSHNWNARYEDDADVVPGGVSEGALVGKVRYVYLPPGRIGPVEGYPLDSMIAP